MTPPLLAIESLTVSIGGLPIVKSVSLQVAAGEIVGLVGASGSGKSMMALAIMQLLPPRALLRGAVHLRGAPLVGKTAAQLRRIRGRDIGMVFQEPMASLNPLMPIGEQVSETVRIHEPVSAARARERARDALDSVGLTGEQGALDRYPHELSGGQRQRVAIAAAVVLRPPLLIADEPTTALDVGAQAQVLALLQDLVRTRGMGLILISHDVAVVAGTADRVAVMQAGEVVEQGLARESWRQLRHPYARALLAAADPIRRCRSAPIDSSAAVLEARGIVREYRRKTRSPWRTPAFRAVDDVSLLIHHGENVGLVGESGSGKSSLLRAILGLERPQAGEIRLLGEVFSSARGPQLRRLRRSIQGVFQDPYGSFDPRWSVERVIAEPFFLLDAPPVGAERRRRVAEVLEQVGLCAADAARRSRDLSGGQRQRIAIARALITEPAVVVFDEAVSALDVLVRAQILDLLVDLSDRLRLAYLFVSHDLNVVGSIADRVYVMRRGRIVEHGPAGSVFGSPRDEYTRSLVAATPRLRTHDPMQAGHSPSA